ncbi:hypothetical protein [Methylobacterium sp. 275MFSha3.1]|nr:hypothetical protein [Methylobacterium sp. 275MFSha3.1]
MTAAFSILKLWFDCRRTQRELALFSERDLADLDLIRSDMTRAAAFRAAR